MDDELKAKAKISEGLEKDLRLTANGDSLEQYDKLQKKIGTKTIPDTLRAIIALAFEYEFEIKPKLIKKALDS